MKRIHLEVPWREKIDDGKGSDAFVDAKEANDDALVNNAKENTNSHDQEHTPSRNSAVRSSEASSLGYSLLIRVPAAVWVVYSI